MAKTFKHLETKAVHAGVPTPRPGGAVVMPIFQSAMFEYAGEGSYHDLSTSGSTTRRTHDALHAKLAAMENGEAALSAASGMAAISTTLLTVLSPGRPSARPGLFVRRHARLPEHGTRGARHRDDFIDADAPASWPALVRPTTRAIYVESDQPADCRSPTSRRSSSSPGRSGSSR